MDEEQERDGETLEDASLLGEITWFLDVNRRLKSTIGQTYNCIKP